MHDLAIFAIQGYIRECYFEPRNAWSSYDFSIRSYSRWAAEEILGRIMDETAKLPPHISGVEWRTPIEIVEEFVEDMDRFSEMGNNPLIFEIAQDVGEDILYFLKGENR